VTVLQKGDGLSQPLLTVRVELADRPYEIQIGTRILSDCCVYLGAAAGRLSHVVLIADQNVEPLARELADAWAEAQVRCDLLTVAPGETSKSIETATRLWNELLACGADRTSLVMAVGGGVTGDLAGFVAATFARGLPLCQIPTTLLAQVDSSVGGKTGVNLPGAKNMVGAFWQPVSVLIDTHVLMTLPNRQYVSGLAEVVKYGVILDADFFEFLERHVAQLTSRDPETLRQVIARCCRLKADVVAADERETSGRRAVLNYGHTFAHALEAVAGYGELLHGEAVSIGMVCASRLAERLGRIAHVTTRRQVELLHALGLPTQLPPLPDEALLQAMYRDKKVSHGQLRFVLPAQLGHVELVSGIESAVVRQILTECH
jgi:3-dehydroquinate synthase